MVWRPAVWSQGREQPAGWGSSGPRLSGGACSPGCRLAWSHNALLSASEVTGPPRLRHALCLGSQTSPCLSKDTCQDSEPTHIIQDDLMSRLSFSRDFSGDPVVRKSSCQMQENTGSTPGLGRSHTPRDNQACDLQPVRRSKRSPVTATKTQHSQNINNIF